MLYNKKERDMYSTRAVASAFSKCLSVTTVVGAGAIRSVAPAISSTPKAIVPKDGRLESRSLIPFSPVSARAIALRKFLL